MAGQPEPPEVFEPEPLLKPAEVADMFNVGPKAVARWGNAGKIRFITTPGPNGKRRYFEADVQAFLRGDTEAAS